MTELPHDQRAADIKWQKYHKLMNLHHELAAYYRMKSRDRKTIAALWARIDALEEELYYMGVEL